MISGRGEQEIFFGNRIFPIWFVWFRQRGEMRLWRICVSAWSGRRCFMI